VRVVVDAASAELGGIRTYVEHLLAAWADAFAQDQLLVVVPSGAGVETAGHRRHELRLRGPAVVARPLMQTLQLPRLARAHRADVVLATNPTTTLVRPGVPVAVVVHDLRHELRSEQFSHGRRALRWAAYGRAYAVAEGFVAVSRRTLDDLHRLHPPTSSKPAVVAHHGADHVRAWPAPERSGHAIAFGHHSNKNPRLVVDAWALLARDGDPPRLLVTGLSGEARTAMAAQVASLGLTRWVELAPYLPEPEFHARFARAELVVFPSDLEGFGLPVVEGMALGKPVVLGPDPGTAEVAAGHAVIASHWSPDALADAVRRAMALGPERLEAAGAHAASFTWERTVRETRGLLERLVGGGR